MSATTLRGDESAVSAYQRVCQVWERSRSVALRAAGAGTPPAGRGAGAAGAAAEAIGHRMPGWRATRFATDLASIPAFHGSEGHQQGPRPASDPGRDPRVARTSGAEASHAGTRTARGSPHRAAYQVRREDPRREGHHPGAQRRCDGDRTACGYSRTYGRRVWAGSSRQSNTGTRECVGWHVCKVGSRFAVTRSDCARGLRPTSLWLTGRRRRPWASASDGSRSSETCSRRRLSSSIAAKALGGIQP